jgi:hypothetical protein
MSHGTVTRSRYMSRGWDEAGRVSQIGQSLSFARSIPGCFTLRDPLPHWHFGIACDTVTVTVTGYLF